MKASSRTAILFIAPTLAVIMVRALALRLLWDWFVHPMLAVPRLTLAYAIGFTLLVQLFMPCRAIPDCGAGDGLDGAAGRATGGMLRELANAGLVALLGWVIHLLTP